MIPTKPTVSCRCYPGIGHEEICPWLAYHQERERIVRKLRDLGKDAHALDDGQIGIWLHGRWWRIVGGTLSSPSLLASAELNTRYPNGLCPKCERPLVRATPNAGVDAGRHGCAYCPWLDPQ